MPCIFFQSHLKPSTGPEWYPGLLQMNWLNDPHGHIRHVDGAMLHPWLSCITCHLHHPPSQ
jgi:hypothetical protein